MRYRVALSYASEDSRFVEYVGKILKRYLGNDAVFHYTDEEHRMLMRDFFLFLDSAEALEPPAPGVDRVRMLCFVHQVGESMRVVTGQETELLESEPRQPHAGEMLTWQQFTNSPRAQHQNVKTIMVPLPNHDITHEALDQRWLVPFSLNYFGQATDSCDLVTDIDYASAEYVAEYVLRELYEFGKPYHSCKAFTYEKDAISFYAKLLRHLRVQPFHEIEHVVRAEFEVRFKAGVPLIWPTCRLRTDLETRENNLLRAGTIGSHRPGIQSLRMRRQDDQSDEPVRMVVSAALSEYHDCGVLQDNPDACMLRGNLSLPEAGPRAKIMDGHPKVGIIVSGGIAPGINAVIDGIVQRHESYDSRTSVDGYRFGLRALAQDSHIAQRPYVLPLRSDLTTESVSRGGSILGTFRLNRLDRPENYKVLHNVMQTLKGLDILYIIGGDGSMKAANFLSLEARKRKYDVSIVGIPKTMDNDILWMWQSFGFATAVEKAREIINHLSTEILSNPRICVLQLFGSVSGFVVSHAVLSSQSGQCAAALIPEAKFTIKKLAEKLMGKFRDNFGNIDKTQLPFGMVVMAEAAIPQDAALYLNDEEFVHTSGLTDDELNALMAYAAEEVYLDGQTSDELRSASLKLVVHGLKKELGNHFSDVRIFSNEPRHILRATNPSFSDIIIGQRLGALAVDNAMAGYSDFMVSQWLTEYVLVPLRLVSLGRKRIPENGIFWKSVLAKTGQGALEKLEN
jgi:6-phosphofructokinase 1